MEKSDKKRILTRVLIVIAALTLLSCCFLGSTFARYVTSAGGSGTVGVAKWDVSVTAEASGRYTFSDLSPDKDGENSGSHSTGWVKVASLRNQGEVDADVTITGSGDVTTTMVKLLESKKTEAEASDKYSAYFSNDSLKKTFKIELASDSNGTELDPTFTLNKTNGSQEVYARVTWTTTSDELDTWYGTYLDSITVTFSFSAVQAEEVPTPAP
mgnify:CR=1 FL=1